MRGSFLVTAAGASLMFLAACGGDNSSGSTATTPVSTPVNNVQTIVVDSGPTVNGNPVGYNDALYTTVTICVPGTATCQSIDHVLVDTGSSGLRLLGSLVTLSLPYATDSSKNLLGNCVQYADSTYQWGAVTNADIKMAGELASSVPIQIVGAANFPAVPTACSAGGMAAQTATDLSANGILGVGLFRQDCGSGCTSTSSPPAVYFSCPTAGCTPTAVSLTAQLQNPVWMFQTDNNGLSILLPRIPATGSLSVSGQMIFGISTQSNNSIGTAMAQGADDFGNFTTTFNGVAYSSSFIDSGSNGYFFLDTATTGLPDCATSTVGAGFYCPTSPVNLTAINTGPNPNGSKVSVAANIAFSVANAATLINSPDTAFNNLGGDNPGMFDWGLPFFFGRTVFIGIESQSSGTAVGPFWAY
jgi:hypothetical protein